MKNQNNKLSEKIIYDKAIKVLMIDKAIKIEIVLIKKMKRV